MRRNHCRDEREPEARDDKGQRRPVRDRQAERHAFVDTEELDQKPRARRQREVPAQHDAVRDVVTTPADEPPRQHAEKRRFVELRRVHPLERGRQALWKRDGPRQIARPSVVVTYQEAPDSPEQMPHGKSGRGGGKDWQNGIPTRDEDGERRADSSEQASEPAQSAATRQQREQRFFSEMFGNPEELGTKQARKHARERTVACALRQTAPRQLTPEQPETDQSPKRDQRTEARDHKPIQPEQFGIHRQLVYLSVCLARGRGRRNGRVARGGRATALTRCSCAMRPHMTSQSRNTSSSVRR